MTRTAKTMATSCALALTCAVALSGAVAADLVDARRAVPPIAGRDVYAILAGNGTTTDALYVADGNNAGDAASITAINATDRRLPWSVRVRYTLDGPDVTRDEVRGASGLVGIHVTAEPRDGSDTNAASHAGDMLVALAIPTRVADDVSAGDDASVTASGSNTVVVGRVGAGDTLDCYMNATKFAMGPLAVTNRAGAAELVERAAALADAALPAQGGSGSGSVSGAAGGQYQQYQGLIDKLTALRDLERSLADTKIAQKTKEYQQAFDAYMAAYVRSYTLHLSGSIGSSTQLGALIGTAGELGGDTPLAKAVVGQANAVDALGMARRHAGAADAIDQVIRLVRQQGTDGLADELRQRAGEERTEGQKGYAAGQAQLSQAMIPYSMAYTDVFTRHLGALTGGSSSGAMTHFDAALSATEKEFSTSADLADDNEKVSAAMAALAAASERSGAGEAYEQVALRFADELAGGGAGAGNAGTAGESGASGTAKHSSVSVAAAATGLAGDHSIAAQAETARLKAQAAAQRKASAAANGDTATTVIDESATQSGADEIAKFAGGVPGVSAAGGKSGDGDTGSGKDGKDTADKPAKATTKRYVTHPSPSYGMAGMGDRSRLKTDLTVMMNDTADLSDAATLLADALRANATDSSSPSGTDTTRLFLLIPAM